MILWLVILLLVANVIYVDIALANLNEKIEGAIAGEADDAYISIAEDIDLVKANVLSCNSDGNCESLFRSRAYTCETGLTPQCEDRFCGCSP